PRRRTRCAGWTCRSCCAWPGTAGPVTRTRWRRGRMRCCRARRRSWSRTSLTTRCRSPHPPDSGAASRSSCALEPHPTFSINARRIRNLPGSRTCSKAALLSRAQLPETDVTFTVVDLLLSRLVTFSVVPAGNWLLEAAGAPPSPERVTVEPLHTCWAEPEAAAPPVPGFPELAPGAALAAAVGAVWES